MKKLTILLALMLLASPAWAQIAFSAASSGSTVSAGDTLNFDHTTTGPHLLLTVPVCYEGAGNSVDDITYNGVSLTPVRQDTEGTANIHSDIWFLTAPPLGTNSVAITTTNSSNRIVAGAISFTGADQSSPLDADGGNNGGPGTSVTNSVTTLSDNTQIVSNVCFGDGTTVTSTDITERWDIDPANVPAGAGGNRSAGAAGAYNADWTIALGRRWATSAASFKSEAAATGVGITGPIVITGPVVVQ